MNNNLLFIGYDETLKMQYIEVPTLFIKYKNAIEKAIHLTFFDISAPNNAVPMYFLDNMKSQFILHKFIRKHTINFFNSIKNETELEELIKKEFKEIFNIKNEKEFKEVYPKYKKDTSIINYMTNLYTKKLSEYKDRLDNIEL